MTTLTPRQAAATAVSIAHVPSRPLNWQALEAAGDRLLARASTRTFSPAATSNADDVVAQQARRPRHQILHPRPNSILCRRWFRLSSRTHRIYRIAGQAFLPATTRPPTECLPLKNMPNLTIKPVTTRREKKQFLELPWQINRGDPNWIPPLRQNQEELVGYTRHPFYDDAEGQTFWPFADGQPVGRIMAILNHAHNRLSQRESRLLWLLRVDRRSGSRRRPVSRRSAIGSSSAASRRFAGR